MKAEIKTGDINIANSMVAAIIRRDEWTAAQDTSCAGNFTFTGEGYSIAGRKVTLAAKFVGANGEAVLSVDAPSSKGGFLQTILEEILTQRQVRWDGELNAESADRLSAVNDTLTIIVDGETKKLSWKPVNALPDLHWMGI
jgi:hypothetical protein